MEGSSERESSERFIQTDSPIVIVKDVQRIPLLAGLICAVTFVAPFFTSLLTGRHFPLTIPTVSESAREWPGSRVFNIGCTMGGVVVATAGWLITDIPSLYGPKLPNSTKILPVMIGVFFVLVSTFGLDDNLFVHLTCAMIGFFSIGIFAVLTFAVFDKLRIVALRTCKIVLLVVSAVALIILAITWPQGNHDPIGSVKSCSEFVFLIALGGYVMTWYGDLKGYSVVMKCG